jgi:phosphoribosyl-ATP pyrophosphohydrolase
VSEIFQRLADAIDARRDASADESYVAGLFEDGIDRILKKIGEEASETIIAGKSGDRTQIVYETADLWFHSVILLKFMNIEPDEVLQELERRFGVSGLAEKASRGRKPS